MYSRPTSCVILHLLAGAKRQALHIGWSQEVARHGTAQKTKMSITRSIFELEAWNFAWREKGKRGKGKKGNTKIKNTWAPAISTMTKYKSTKIQKWKSKNKKVQKYKNAKTQKRKKYKKNVKNVKTQKNVKSPKMQKSKKQSGQLLVLEYLLYLQLIIQSNTVEANWSWPIINF